MTVKGIAIQNIYYMLAYAFRTLREGDYARVSTEDFENAEDLFGEILSIGISRLLKRGLHRMYEEQTEDLRGLRGKVELAPTIRHWANHRKLITCTHDEFTVNNPFNQILKSTAEGLVRTGRLVKSRSGLMRVLRYFATVDSVPLRQIKWANLRYERSNRHYQMLMNVCRFVIDGLLMGEDAAAGERKIRSMEIDESKMASLYEGFLREYYAVHYRLNSASKKIAWDVPSGTDVSQLPMMVSDITLTDGVKTLILDAKFYGSIMQENYEKHSYRNSHINQVLVYALNEHNRTGKEVAATLLYAKTGECEAKPGRWPIGGYQIGVEIIDLGASFADISAQLDKIVADYFGAKKCA